MAVLVSWKLPAAEDDDALLLDETLLDEVLLDEALLDDTALEDEEALEDALEEGDTVPLSPPPPQAASIRVTIHAAARLEDRWHPIVAFISLPELHQLDDCSRLRQRPTSAAHDLFYPCGERIQ